MSSKSPSESRSSAIYLQGTYPPPFPLYHPSKPTPSRRAASVFTILCGTLLYTWVKTREASPAKSQTHNIPIEPLRSGSKAEADLEAQAPLMGNQDSDIREKPQA